MEKQQEWVHNYMKRKNAPLLFESELGDITIAEFDGDCVKYRFDVDHLSGNCCFLQCWGFNSDILLFAFYLPPTQRQFLALMEILDTF